jgi:hypothetical protein
VPSPTPSQDTPPPPRTDSLEKLKQDARAANGSCYLYTAALESSLGPQKLIDITENLLAYRPPHVSAASRNLMAQRVDVCNLS